MNPQQFQNMAGMGRGMPNMNMNMAMNSMNQNMGQQRGPPNFLQIIYQNLTQSQNVDGPFQGWRAGVSIQERAGQIKILFDSLRMLGSSVDIQRSLDIALAFERKQFMSSASQEVYKQSIHDKLSSIRDQRQQHVNANTNMPPGNMQMAQNAGFPQQQPPQISQMGPAMNFSQQGMQHSPMMNQMPGQQNMNSNQVLNQQLNNNNTLNQQNRANVPELSKDDNTWINTRAAEMAKSTPREQMREIVDSMDPRIRMNLQEKKIDPIIYHFRMKATREFRLKQQHQQQQQQQQQQQVAAANQQGNMNFNAMRRTPAPGQNMNVPVSQPNSASFMGNIDQIRDQQEEGMRSQQQGQLVVPASNQSNGAEALRAQQQTIANQLRKQYPHATQPQLGLLMRQRMAQIQQQQLTRQLQANTQGSAMQNMNGGQNLAQGVPQPPLGMSNLAQPANMPNGSPAQNVAGSARVQGHPGQPQPQQSQQQQAQSQSQQQGININHIQQNFGKLPPALQQKLRNTPNHNEWVGIVNQWRATQAQMQRQQMPPNATDLRRSTSQQAPQNFQQMPNPGFVGPPPMQPSLSAGAEQNNVMQNMTPVQRPMSMNPNVQNGVSAQNQSQQRQPPMSMPQGNPMNQQDPNMKMVQALVHESENYPVPPQVLAKIQAIYMQGGVGFPQIQSWGLLKQFVKTHPNHRVQIPALLQAQVTHARSVKLQNNNKQENMSGMPQGVQAQMPSGAPSMKQAVGGPGVRGSVTQQEIQRMKAQNPNYAHLSDNQLHEMLAQKINAQKPPQQPGPAVTNMPSGQNIGAMAGQVQNNVRAPNQAMPKPATQPVANRPQLPNQPQNQNQNQNQAQGQAPVPAGPKANENRLKRPNQDEAQETLNVQQKRFEITKAEFDSYTPEQKEKFLTERKKIETAIKMAKMKKLNQEVQANMAQRRPPPITNMDPASRQHIIKMLTSENTKKILERFDSFLLAFDQFEKDDNMLKVLIQHRWHLMQQFKPESWANKSYQPADNFTLQADNIEKILSTVTAKFQQAIQKSQNQGPARPQLTQENLITAATQAAQQQKLSKMKPKDGPPPAPTVDKPPFSFSDDRGRGTPKYANQGIKQEDLKLPPNKRLKGGPSTPSTPIQAPQPKPTFKCSVPGCSVQLQGFNTQAELEAHRNMAHQELSVKDPIGFLNSSLQQAFNLDPNMEAKGMKIEQLADSPMPMASNKATTPMARGPSQQDNKAMVISQPSVKADAQGVKNAMKPSDLGNDSTIKNEWDDTTFTFDDLTNVFGSYDNTDMVPTQQDSYASSMRAIEAFMGTDEWKQAIGTYNSSEDSSMKSKSPDRGSEQSLPTKTQNEADKDPFYVDLTTGRMALPVLEGNFEDLLVNDDFQGGDWTMVDAEGSLSPWEKIDESSEGDSKKKDHAWVIDLNAPSGDPFPDDDIDKLLDGDTFEAMLATNDPGVYAAGSTEWNAIGKKGEEMRRSLGWPIEGVQGVGKR